MRAYAILRLPTGGHCQLHPGDQIGRHTRCALQLTDQRVSEAHAMLAMRGGDLRLLGLRGGLAIDGRIVRDPILEPGLTIELAPGLAVEIREVSLPRRVLAVRGPGLRLTQLGGTMSLFLTPRCELVNGYRPEAVAWLHDDGEHWFCSTADGIQGPLHAGAPLELPGWTGELVWKDLETSAPATLDPYRPDEALRIEAWFDSVRLFQAGRMQVQLSGRQARVLSELVQIAQPVAWEAVAAEVWSDVQDRWLLRKRWDTNLRRLRRSLADGGIRSDLVASDGTGCVALVAYPGDELVVMD